MKEEICRFALKMTSDGRSRDELVDYMLQCLVCKKFHNKLAFDFKTRFGIDLRNLTVEQAEMLGECLERASLEEPNQFF